MNNIALIKLKHPIARFNKDLLTWCSADFDNARNFTMHAIGMGHTREGSQQQIKNFNEWTTVRPSELANVLQEVQLEERFFSVPFCASQFMIIN